MKKLAAASLTLTAFLSAALPAHAGAAIDCGKTGAGFNALCNLKTDNIGQIVGTAITILLIVAVIIALFFLVWGGIRWITSGGDKGKVEGARNTIVAAIVGLIIAFLAFFILQVALGFFGLDLAQLTLPKFTGN